MVYKQLCPQTTTWQKSTLTSKILTNGQLAKIVHEQATLHLDHLQHSPALKWTWGTDLDLNDIRQCVRGADKGNCIPHSGYDGSLPKGRLGGEDSAGPSSLPITSGSVLFPNVSATPVSELDVSERPEHFREFPLQHPYTCVPNGVLPEYCLLYMFL